MEESDHTAQLPLPAVPDKAGARVISLPLPARPRPAPAGRPGKSKRPALWYALYFPQLTALPGKRQQELLNLLATEVEQVSSTVSFHPQALICEVRSSLKYFGGLESIHEHLQQPLKACLERQELSAQVYYAASPTVTGSLLLARSGHNGLVYRRQNLRSALGRLPTDVLQLDREPSRRLYNMGVRCLRDLWRLPGDGLRRRFGSDLPDQLDRALGLAPEPTRNYTPPPAFHTAVDLPHAVENLDRLLPVADEMLAWLVDFLSRRDLSTSYLVFTLQHENREATVVKLGLRQPSRCRRHLLGLLQTHCSHLALPAPVVAVKLQVKKFDAFMGRSESLFSGQPADAAANSRGNLNLFMEQLRARLGGEPVQSINTVAEHGPEYACRQLHYDSARPKRQRHDPAGAVSDNPRPLWLLPQPRRLTLRGGRLYHRRPLAILRGPERIETRWWSGADIRRDYYIARECSGGRLWIYRERSGEHHWYLHGIFA